MSKQTDASNARRLRRACDLIYEGKVHEGYDLMADMPYGEFYVALESIVAQGARAKQVLAIAKRNNIVGGTVGEILRRSAKAGDHEAIDLIADGFLQEKWIEPASA